MKTQGKDGAPKIRHSLRTRITVAFSFLCGTALLLLGCVCYYISYKTMQTNLIYTTSALVDQVTHSLDVYLEEATSTIRSVAIGEDFINSFKQYPQMTDEEKYNIQIRNVNALKELMLHKPDMQNVILYNNRNLAYHTLSNLSFLSNSAFLQSLWSSFEGQGAPALRFSRPHIPDYYNIPQTVITISTPIYDIQGLKKDLLAVALMDINLSKIQDIFAHLQFERNEKLVILNDQNQIIYSTNLSRPEDLNIEQMVSKSVERPRAFYQELLGENQLVSHSSSSVSGWKVFYLFPTSVIEHSLGQTRGITVGITIASIVVTFFIAVFLSRGSLKPIAVLTQHMKKVEEGDFQTRLPQQDQIKEFNILSTGFNHMVSRVNQLVQENEMQARNRQIAESDALLCQIRQKEAEFEALQAKINPHFLYNTLQTIKSLAVLEETESVAKVAVMLGNMLEYLVYKSDLFVPINRELKYIEDYLAIQQIRFSNRFHVDFQTDDAAREYQIIKMLLQPVIENIFKHGFPGGMEGGQITIKTEVLESGIRFSISDNGAGIEEAQLFRVRAKLSAEKSTGGIGLKNVSERLRLQYGEAGRLTINSSPGRGCTVCIHIPKERVAHSADNSFSGRRDSDG